MTSEKTDRLAFGISLIILAVFMMSVQEALFKRFSDDLSLWQIFTLRGLIVSLPLAVMAFSASDKTTLHQALDRWAIARSCCLSFMFLAMYSAIPFLPLATIAAGIYTAPLFVTLITARVIGKAVPARTYLAVTIGFVGVVIILNPGSELFSLWATLPVAGGFFYALANVCTRERCQRLSPISLTVSLNLTLTLIGIAGSATVAFSSPSATSIEQFSFLTSAWTELNTQNVLLLLALALLFVIIGTALAAAYQQAPAPSIATFDYCYLIFVAIWDALIFDTFPSVKMLIGIALILFAGMLVSTPQSIKTAN